jgi:Tfp pilus assembly pilus retraction ATPase PilT
MTVHLDLIDRYLAEIWDRHGTDLLLTVGASPMARLDGHLVPISDEGTLTDSDLDAVVRSLVTTEVFQRLHETRELDLSFEWEG